MWIGFLISVIEYSTRNNLTKEGCTLVPGCSMDRNGEASSPPAVLQEWEALSISASLEPETEEQCHVEHDLHWPFVFHQQ